MGFSSDKVVRTNIKDHCNTTTCKNILHNNLQELQTSGNVRVIHETINPDYKVGDIKIPKEKCDLQSVACCPFPKYTQRCAKAPDITKP